MATHVSDDVAPPADHLPADEQRTCLRDWYVVAVLIILMILAQIDRNVLNLLVTDLKRDLVLTDTQVSYLLGAAFLVPCALVALPAGYLIDRYNRRFLLAGAVLVWTLMTGFSGLAATFMILLIGRMGVGVGETILNPAVYSLIRDSFPPAGRARAFGLVNFGSGMGAGFSLVVVGTVIGWVPTEGIVVPGMGQFHSWQIVLLLLGLTGLPLALLPLTIAEPRVPAPKQSRESASIAVSVLDDFKSSVGYIVANKAIYVPLLIAILFTTAAQFALHAWIPTFVSRHWEVAPRSVGVTLGSLQMVMAIPGTLMAGVLMDWLVKRKGTAVVFLVGSATTLAAAVLVPLAVAVPAVATFWVIYGLLTIAMLWSALVCHIALANVTPANMMGKVAGLSFLVTIVLGGATGPTLVALVSDHFFVGPSAIGEAVGLTVTIMLAISSACLFISRKRA